MEIFDIDKLEQIKQGIVPDETSEEIKEAALSTPETPVSSTVKTDETPKPVRYTGPIQEGARGIPVAGNGYS